MNRPDRDVFMFVRFSIPVIQAEGVQTNHTIKPYLFTVTLMFTQLKQNQAAKGNGNTMKYEIQILCLKAVLPRQLGDQSKI